MNSKQLIKALAMTLIALGVGVGVASALNLDNENKVILDPVAAGVLGITKYNGAGDGIQFAIDIFGFTNFDQIDLKSGNDEIWMNSGNDSIQFTADEGADWDGVYVDEQSSGSSTDDVMVLRGDSVEIETNSGSVIIRLSD